MGKISVILLIVVSLGLTIGLLAGSWRVVTPMEWGIKYSPVTKSIDTTTVYTAGRYYTGPGGYFFKYAKNLVHVDLQDVDVWSNDGQQVVLDASFYYRLQGNRIFDLFFTYGNASNVDIVIQEMAAETIRDVATLYKTVEFFTNRSELDTRLSKALQQRLSADIWTNMTLFNLLSINIPSPFEKAVINKVITAQSVATLLAERNATLIRTGITLASGGANATILTLNGTAQTNATIILGTAIAGNLEKSLTARASKLRNVTSDLGFTTPQQALKFIYTDLLRRKTNPNVTAMYDVDSLILARSGVNSL